MTEDQRFLAIGIYINSALYLTGVFVAGLVTNNPSAWKSALFSAGIAYLAYYAQVAKLPIFINGILTGITLGSGSIAGVFLLVH